MPIKELEITATTIDNQIVTVTYDNSKPDKISVEGDNNTNLQGILVSRIVPLVEAYNRAERMSDN